MLCDFFPPQMRRRRLEKLSNLPLRSQTDPTPPKTTPTKVAVVEEAGVTSSSAPSIPLIVTENEVIALVEL